VQKIFHPQKGAGERAPPKYALGCATQTMDLMPLGLGAKTGKPKKLLKHRSRLLLYQHCCLASYTSAGMATIGMSVSPSVCHILVGLLYQNERHYYITDIDRLLSSIH